MLFINKIINRGDREAVAVFYLKKIIELRLCVMS